LYPPVNYAEQNHYY